MRINGNGFRIRTSGTWTGHFTLRYADVSGLGKLNDGQLAMDVTTTAPLALENCNYRRLRQTGVYPERHRHGFDQQQRISLQYAGAVEPVSG